MSSSVLQSSQPWFAFAWLNQSHIFFPVHKCSNIYGDCKVAALKSCWQWLWVKLQSHSQTHETNFTVSILSNNLKVSALDRTSASLPSWIWQLCPVNKYKWRELYKAHSTKCYRLMSLINTFTHIRIYSGNREEPKTMVLLKLIEFNTFQNLSWASHSNSQQKQL